MPNVHKLFSSRIKTDVHSFVGESGRIFYNEETGELRLSDGITPYGLPIYFSGQGSGSLVLDRYVEVGVPAISPGVLSNQVGIGIGDSSVVRQWGGFVQASGSFGSVGDAQVGSYVLRCETSSNLYHSMYLDGSNRSINIGINQAVGFRILIIGRRIDSVSSEGGVYEISGGIDRAVSIASCRLIGVPSRVVYSEDNPAWDVRVLAENGQLVVQVRGEHSKVIRWVGYVQTVEVSGV